MRCESSSSQGDDLVGNAIHLSSTKTAGWPRAKACLENCLIKFDKSTVLSANTLDNRRNCRHNQMLDKI
jgi:hypothetical protein